MKTYKVLEYNPYSNDPKFMGRPSGTHTCLVSEPGRWDRKEYIDLMVNGDLPKDTDPESLVGRTFTAGYDYPYVSIAMYVREVTPRDPCATGPGVGGSGA